MRDQFYGDSRDVLKWSILLRLAGADKHILYVAMARPNHGRHGNNRAVVPGADPRVVEFFQTERRAFPERRRLRRIQGLLPGRITVAPAIHYEHQSREEYFEEACQTLSSISRPLVVFLDPDSGIAGKCPKSVHVCQAELTRIWALLEPGDSLVVYQHRFRDRDWLSKRREVLERAVSSVDVRVAPEVPTDVAFFVAEPRQTRGHGFSRAVQAP